MPSPKSHKKVSYFYWQRIIYRFSTPRVIILDNGAQFASSIVDFYHDLWIHMKFISVVHLLTNRQTESANKVILGSIKKKFDDSKGL